MKESYKEELAIHFGLEPYAGDGEKRFARVRETLREGQTRFSVFRKRPLVIIAQQGSMTLVVVPCFRLRPSQRLYLS